MLRFVFHQTFPALCLLLLLGTPEASAQCAGDAPAEIAIDELKPIHQEDSELGFDAAETYDDDDVQIDIVEVDLGELRVAIWSAQWWADTDMKIAALNRDGESIGTPVFLEWSDIYGGSPTLQSVSQPPPSDPPLPTEAIHDDRPYLVIAGSFRQDTSNGRDMAEDQDGVPAN